MSRRSFLEQFVTALSMALPIALSSCGGGADSPLNAPMRYTTTDELKARLEEVAKYGDGGSSLGGIPESIAELTKADPAKGEKLLGDFKRLDAADSKEERQKIAKEMAEKL